MNKNKIPLVISDVLLRASQAEVGAYGYNDGGTYSDGYGDDQYGDYGDSQDPDPVEN